MHKIYIPSKGRPDNVKTLKLVDRKFAIIVVEPQEESSYREANPDVEILVLPENDKGIVYVRKGMFVQIEEWAWVMDDDINKFYLKEGNKTTKTDFAKLKAYAENGCKSKSVVIFGLEYQQFAWSGKQKFTTNSYCDVCIFMNAKKIRELGITYDEKVALKEDRDIVIQVVHSGYKTARTNQLSFSAPKNGSNAGGLKEIAYDVEGKELAASLAMVEKWGNPICVLNEKSDGRPDVKINWKFLK